MKNLYAVNVKLMSNNKKKNKKRKFRLTRGFMLVLELKGFYSGSSNTFYSF